LSGLPPDLVREFTFEASELDEAEAESDGPGFSFAGRGVWAWKGEQLDPDELAAQLAAARFHYLSLKAHDGTAEVAANRAVMASYSAAASRRRVAFGIWGALTARTVAAAEAEARLAAELVARYRASFYVADAERAYETSREPVSRTFASAFRRRLPELPAALSSFGRIDLHSGIDWKAWREHGFEFHPQAYECEGPRLTPRACVKAATSVWPLGAIRPTVGAYTSPKTNVRLSPESLAAGLKGLGTNGFSVYRAGTASGEDYRLLGKVPVGRHAVKARTREGAAAAVAFAVAHIGHEEDYPFRNRSRLIDEWGAPYGSPQKPGQVGWEWCGIFVAACLRAGGLHVPKGIIWTPTGFSWGEQGTNGFEKGIYRPSQARPGDLVYFDWPHQGNAVDHVGIVRRNLGNGILLTVEGNTHPDAPPIKGSDYGVFQHHRSAGIRGCTRPRYSG
jgi:CHAP domain